MSELESLFLVVFLVYLVQCIHWVSPGTAVFALGSGGTGKWKRRGFVWSALTTEGFLAAPLPLLAPLVVQAWPSFELDPDGVSVRVQSGEWTRQSWGRLALSGSGAKLRCGGVSIFHGSETQVAEYSRLLDQLQRAESGLRGPMIERWLEKATRMTTARRRLRVFNRRSRFVRILANVQLLFLFVAVPLAFSRLGPGILWRVLVFLGTMQASITLEFWRLHKKLFRRAGNARFKAAITILLSPVAAIRTCDVLAHDLLSGFHPIAVAGAVLTPGEFELFAGSQLRQWRFGDHPGAWYRDTMAAAMEKVIRKSGIRPDTLLRPAERESGCVVYCPRCLAQYVKDNGACSDCGFEKLAAFSSQGKRAPGRTRSAT